ncbi:septation protein A [Oceanicella actignis]|uniref:Inner membrane-spanning protein YciB n=1 Tax=Oceanicella actignis TaxID=1189325 RepID=A0A1M7TEF6_9RHOB|nr:septation protein A [Oceanicella actignis]SET62317.1 intracellular septation protein [Oceanicella actignis]SHN69110.1 intracellular septation protein [Oceanicella actignis]
MPQTKHPHPLVKMALELGPIAVFFVTYSRSDIFTATAVFVPVVLASLAAGWALTRSLPRMAVVTAVVVTVFGGLTLWLQDATFIKMKPTIVNLIFAAMLGWGLLRGQSYIRYLMGDALSLTDEGWMAFTRRWALFFVFMAALNELVWRTQSEAFWVSFKTFGSPLISLAFIAAQTGLLRRHAAPEDKADDAPPQG